MFEITASLTLSHRFGFGRTKRLPGTAEQHLPKCCSIISYHQHTDKRGRSARQYFEVAGNTCEYVRTHFQAARDDGEISPAGGHAVGTRFPGGGRHSGRRCLLPLHREIELNPPSAAVLYDTTFSCLIFLQLILSGRTVLPPKSSRTYVPGIFFYHMSPYI